MGFGSCLQSGLASIVAYYQTRIGNTRAVILLRLNEMEFM